MISGCMISCCVYVAFVCGKCRTTSFCTTVRGLTCPARSSQIQQQLQQSQQATQQMTQQMTQQSQQMQNQLPQQLTQQLQQQLQQQFTLQIQQEFLDGGHW